MGTVATNVEDFDLLVKLIEQQGFEVCKGEPLMYNDGTRGSLYLRPVDARKLMQAAIKAIDSRS
jgi:hypothetical protein